MIKPMLAKAAKTLPVGPEWTYEVKWDGYRVLAVKDGPKVRLFSRTLHDLTPHFQPVADAVAKLDPRQVILDGELVALDATGHPSFRGLQAYHRHIADANGLALAFYAFDLIELNGRSWIRRPLAARRKQLGSLIRGDTVLVSSPLPGHAADIAQRIREFGLEGVVAKRRDSLYRPDTRSDDWRKVRFSPRQEFVIGGYVPRGDTFDSVLVGYYTSEGILQYAGHVRDGFSARTRAALSRRWRRPITRCPFVDLPHQIYRHRHPWDQRIGPEQMSTIRWVPPSEVIEVAYLGWTRHDVLRQAQFVGVRDDKPARHVRRD